MRDWLNLHPAAALAVVAASILLYWGLLAWTMLAKSRTRYALAVLGVLAMIVFIAALAPGQGPGALAPR